jgi:hypothetical protein
MEWNDYAGTEGNECGGSPAIQSINPDADIDMYVPSIVYMIDICI